MKRSSTTATAHVSIGAMPEMWERTLTFNGLSKAYAMTGWRLGYVAGPKTLIDEIAKVQSHSVTHATSFVQAGGVAALTGPQEFIGEMVTAWDRRRLAVAEGLNRVKGYLLEARGRRVLRLSRCSPHRHGLHGAGGQTAAGSPRRGNAGGGVRPGRRGAPSPVVCHQRRAARKRGAAHWRLPGMELGTDDPTA